MKKQLFFDDSRLFGRENVERRYGRPTVCAVYYDEVCSTDFISPFVFKLDDGSYRMIYFAHGKDFKGKKLFCAKSFDGINFSPEKLCLEGKKYEHEIMNLDSCEIADIYEDKHCDKSERYKLLMARPDGQELTVRDELYTSPDLLNWTIKKGVSWGNDTEPLASVFYNEYLSCHTIIERPFWGVRLVGYKETADFENFSEYRFCLRTDSCDEPLSEIYGMYAFDYDGMFVGLPHIYRGLKSELNAKYKNGYIDTQLAYSYDGRYWHRSLREPFISGVAPDENGNTMPLVWVSAHTRQKNEIILYGSYSKLEHGPAFVSPGSGSGILVHKLRKDGFISFDTNDKNLPSVVTTREKVWHEGELFLNIKAQKATVAVYESTEDQEVEGMNVLGNAVAVEGFSHEDCLPFSGDDTEWSPKFKNGKKISELAGRVLVFEIRFENGSLYSLSGNFTDVFNTEGARYRKFGVLPKI